MQAWDVTFDANWWFTSLYLNFDNHKNHANHIPKLICYNHTRCISRWCDAPRTLGISQPITFARSLHESHFEEAFVHKLEQIYFRGTESSLVEHKVGDFVDFGDTQYPWLKTCLSIISGCNMEEGFPSRAKWEWEWVKSWFAASVDGNRSTSDFIHLKRLVRLTQDQAKPMWVLLLMSTHLVLATAKQVWNVAKYFIIRWRVRLLVPSFPPC